MSHDHIPTFRSDQKKKKGKKQTCSKVYNFSIILGICLNKWNYKKPGPKIVQKKKSQQCFAH
jgi:hypothetical protein